MNYKLRGSLCGYLCDDCTEPISGIEVLLYLPWQKERITENAIASTKDTFRFVSKEESAERKSLLIATVQTDEGGNFEFDLDEQYGKTAFDIDFICGNVPRPHPKAPRNEPVQFHLTTLYPQWRISNQQESYYYQWQYCIPNKWWCHIRGYHFDAWVICGHLRACQTGAAIPNAKVTAWDADFITDDNLGTAVTDASGHFRIDYTSIQFKQTFLSPWINVETDPGTLSFQSGPDVYFKAEIGGVTIINETAANRRNNVGYCLCVDLCANIETPPPPVVPIPAFIRIGGLDYETQVQSHVGETGLTNSNYAFFSSLRLNGIMSQTFGGAPMEYCFEYTKQYNGLGQPINWNRVLDNQINATDIGYVEKATLMPPDISHPTSWYHYDYVHCIVSNVAPSAPSIQVPIDVNGWILVPQQNDNPLNPAGVGMFVANGNQVNLDTVSLDAFPAIDLTGLVAGNSSTSTGKPLAGDEIFAVRMLVRQQGNNATITEAGRCTRIAIDNTRYTGMVHHPEWGPFAPAIEDGVCMLDILQLQMAGCAKITSQVDILFTCAHPHLGVVTLKLKGPSGEISLPVPPITPDMAVTVTHLFAPADPLCAYLVTLKATYFLTTGDSNLTPPAEDQIAFCR